MHLNTPFGSSTCAKPRRRAISVYIGRFAPDAQLLERHAEQPEIERRQELRLGLDEPSFEPPHSVWPVRNYMKHNDLWADLSTSGSLLDFRKKQGSDRMHSTSSGFDFSTCRLAVPRELTHMSPTVHLGAERGTTRKS